MSQSSPALPDAHEALHGSLNRSAANTLGILQNRVARALQAFQRGASLAALHELARHQSPLLDSGTESVWIPNIAKIPAPCSRLTTFARTSSVLCPLYSPQLDPTLAFAFTKGAERVSRTALKPFCTRKST